MVPKSLALSGLAIVVIAGMIMVSACTGTPTPTATPTAAPSATPTAAPTAAPPANVTAAFNQSDNNRTVSVKNGETFKITLEENLSTGYSWNASVTSGLTIVNDTYLQPNATGMVGVAGMHQWLVMATGTGDQNFSAVYKRPREPIFGNETTYVLKVNVTAPALGALP